MHTAGHLAHWGAYTAHTDGRDITSVTPWSGDSAPSPLLGNIPGSVTHPSRVGRPAVRRAWWDNGPGPDPTRGRGSDWVRPPWDEVLDALADELRRVVRDHGNTAIHGGSYGWASAGRFHHAQSQLHRFLNLIGGYTASVNSYSTGAAEVILPRIVADESVLAGHTTTWDVIEGHTELLLAFGGLPVKNAGTDAGGSGDHPLPGVLQRLRARGVRVLAVGPLADDLADATGPARPAPVGAYAPGRWAAPAAPDDAFRWWPTRPGTDVALLLALTHTLLAEGLADTDFLATHCVGVEEFHAYLFGASDGVVKDADWAAPVVGANAGDIRDLARLAAASRTLVTIAWSLQRAAHGEQPPWAGLAFAAHLGQIGLPGGGFGNGYGSMNKPGLSPAAIRLPSVPQGMNPSGSVVPVASLAHTLTHPGEHLTYDGRTLTLPDIRLVFWAGGNPFHHHQDLAGLRRALGRPDTVVVVDPYWTAMARHADIVLPSTTSLERDDFSGARSSGRLVAMRAAVPPYAASRDDYDTYADLADRLGVGAPFTQGRTSADWLRRLYDAWRDDAAARIGGLPRGADLPDFDTFWRDGSVELPRSGPITVFDAFRDAPDAHPLTTPSGRIEIGSQRIADLGLPDCPGHPTWFPPPEGCGSPRAAQFPLVLVANQPRTRLHSQLDHGATSQAAKVAGREPIRLHPQDAADRGISDGDVVRVFNDVGEALAGAVVSTAPMPGVVQLSTGAWYDPLDGADRGPAPEGGWGLGPDACVHGNPNVLTPDRLTSGLAQACTGQHVLVQVERWDRPAPPVRAFTPPA